MDRCDQASQAQQQPPPPPAARADGAPCFPEHDWWLTELEQRRPAAADVNMEDEIIKGCVITHDGALVNEMIKNIRG